MLRQSESNERRVKAKQSKVKQSKATMPIIVTQYTNSQYQRCKCFMLNSVGCMVVCNVKVHFITMNISLLTVVRSKKDYASLSSPAV